ncbi:DUF1569 domain-containing protein [Rhodopirellula sp. JC639]|uniref:DUF1569 domain-containing protein n=1 Tax=Stieleria mannarensis TaxID=2755585 RepID=UPI0016043F71|nr:DUF1569 domain-containing protein [Rhodopirellula sp. JC639]
MNELRTLQFDDLDAAVREARALHEAGYTRQGSWSLGQICRHLVLVQQPSLDGYPAWMSLFSFLRPIMRRWLLPKVLRPDSPRGIRTASIFEPPDELNDAAEVDAFADSVEKLKAHSGGFYPHPAFGRLPREQILAIHAAHAAHHLRFLQSSPPRAAVAGSNRKC